MQASARGVCVCALSAMAKPRACMHSVRGAAWSGSFTAGHAVAAGGGSCTRGVQARELAALLGRYDLRGHVNLIPWNPVADSAFQRPAPRAVKAFSQARALGPC